MSDMETELGGQITDLQNALDGYLKEEERNSFNNCCALFVCWQTLTKKEKSSREKITKKLKKCVDKSR